MKTDPQKLDFWSNFWGSVRSSRALIGFNYCAKLYVIEKDLKQQHSQECNYYTKRYEKRLEESKSIIDEFMAYVDRELENAVPRSALGKALAYIKPLLQSFKNVFLEDGIIEIDNNSAERLIRALVIGRKIVLTKKAYLKYYHSLRTYLKI
ncbi:IS66 family transposase [Anaeromonas gelatinilytica]|uniref:IS66 family transposase n=1 Tax=Anaeromonas gelatinilytica TaxID=2683194 RepID=UPI003315E319